MRNALDPHLIQTRPLELVSIQDTHNHKQFEADPADPVAHPPLYDRDVLAILPFQVNANKFVIPYYVMTRDIRRDLPPENFTVTLKGLNGKAPKLTAYDPILDQRLDVQVISNEQGLLRLNLSATDYPILLEVHESP
jgi:hypothetical protein